MDKNIILKTIEEVSNFQKLILISISLEEKTTFLILTNEVLLDLESLRFYLIENELNQFARNEVIRLLEGIDIFLKYKTRYEQLPVSELGYSYEYPTKGKGFGDGSLTYVRQVSNGFLRIDKESFEKREPSYLRLRNLNYTKIESRLLEIKDLFTDFVVQHKTPELEEIEINHTSKIEKYLGQPTNEKANDFFDFLIEYYRPEDKTQIKFVNILHYLKNDADKNQFIFRVKQKEYKNLVIQKTGIKISKFDKSAKYIEEEKPIFHKLENTFLKTKTV